MAPVRKRPLGTSTRPPPLAAQAPIAERNAAVQSVWPSGFAPYFVTSKVRLGNFVGMMRATMASAWAHGDVLATALCASAVHRSPGSTRPAPARAAVRRNVRRDSSRIGWIYHKVAKWYDHLLSCR